MRNFFSLLKIQFTQIIGTMFFKTKSKKASTFILLFLLFVGAIGGSLGSLYYQIGSAFKLANMTEFVFFQAGIMSFMLIIMLITVEAQTYFFKTKDFEFLSSLPLSSTSIVFSKFFAVLISAYIYTFMAFVPAIVVYFILTGFSFSIFLLSILGILFFPFLPTALGLILGLIASYISSKTKKSSLFNFIFIALFCFGYMYLSLSFNDIIQSIVSAGTSFLTAITYTLPTIGLFISGIILGDMLHIALYIGLNIGVLCLTCLIVSALYKNINLKLNRTHIKVSNKEIQYKKTSVIVTLLKNEASRYFSIASYFFNTFIMGFMGVVFPIIIYLSGLKTIGLDAELAYIMAEIIVVISCITLPTCNTTCSSISIEGTKFATLKAFPIKEETILFTKILFNILLVVPMCILSNIVSFALFGSLFTLKTALALILLPIIATISSSIYGLLVNLYFPKLKFENYTQVIKQSAASVLGILGSMFFCALPFILYLSFFKTTVDFGIFTIIAGTFYILWGTICLVILKLKGKQLFNSIEF